MDSLSSRMERAGNSGKGTLIVLSLACVVTILSQLVDQFSLPVKIIWVAILLFLVLANGARIRFSGISSLSIILVAIFALYCSICALMTNDLHYISGILSAIVKTLFIYLIGYCLPYSMGFRDLKALICVYMISAALYALWVMLNYYPGATTWLSNMVYLFPQKNSFGQIISAGILVLFCMAGQSERFGTKVVLVIVAALLFISVVFMQCRTAILGICIALLALLITAKRRALVIILVIAAIAAIIFSPTIQTYLSHALFLDKYMGADANTFSSGRLAHWASAVDAVRQSNRQLIGLGSYYVDCLYLNLYANVGIIGGVIILIQWIARIFYNIRPFAIRQTDDTAEVTWLKYALLALTFFYIVESMLEGLPPYGPGTCSFLFWILCGYSDSIDRGSVSGRSNSISRMPTASPFTRQEEEACHKQKVERNS